MADSRNLNINDIDAWGRQAPPEQVVQAAHKLLDVISGYSDQHRQTFNSQMQSSTRKNLFQNEPVG